MQGTVKGGRRQGEQRKRWEDNIREWTGLKFVKSQRAVENREKWREKKKTGCKIICGATTTLAVKGLMRMMRRRSLKAGKSPRVDNTFSELLQSEGEAATTVLTAICQKIWETKECPREWI